METGSGRFDWARLVAGLAILGIGAVLALNQAGFSASAHFWDFWPLILIAIGITRSADADDAERRQSWLTLIFIGCWLLIASLGLFGLDYGDSWPLAVVAVGLSILLTAWSLLRAAKGVFLVLLGIWLQITELGLFGLTMEATWPFAIVGLGVWIALGSFLQPSARRGRRGGGQKQEGWS